MPHFRVKGHPELTEDEWCREALRQAHRRGDLMSLAQVAKHLGIAERTLRGWIANGSFPPAPVETTTRKDFWPKVTVLGFQAAQIAIGHPVNKRSLLPTNDAIDEADEARFEALDIDQQNLERKYHRMSDLFQEDRNEFEKRFPRLKEWSRDYRKPASHWRVLASKEK